MARQDEVAMATATVPRIGKSAAVIWLVSAPHFLSTPYKVVQNPHSEIERKKKSSRTSFKKRCGIHREKPAKSRMACGPHAPE
jgi:hypothetical protein